MSKIWSFMNIIASTITRSQNNPEYISNSWNEGSCQKISNLHIKKHEKCDSRVMK